MPLIIFRKKYENETFLRSKFLSILQTLQKNIYIQIYSFKILKFLMGDLRIVQLCRLEMAPLLNKYY